MFLYSKNIKEKTYEEGEFVATNVFFQQPYDYHKYTDL